MNMTQCRLERKIDAGTEILYAWLPEEHAEWTSIKLKSGIWQIVARFTTCCERSFEERCIDSTQDSSEWIIGGLCLI